MAELGCIHGTSLAACVAAPTYLWPGPFDDAERTPSQPHLKLRIAFSNAPLHPVMHSPQHVRGLWIHSEACKNMHTQAPLVQSRLGSFVLYWLVMQAYEGGGGVRCGLAAAGSWQLSEEREEALRRQLGEALRRLEAASGQDAAMAADRARRRLAQVSWPPL